MQKLMITRMIILSTLVLSSCKIPNLEPQVRMIYSEHFRECRCQFYDYMTLENKTDPVACDEFHESIKSGSSAYCNASPENEMCKRAMKMDVMSQLDYCEGLIGHDPRVWGQRIKPWIFRLIEQLKDSRD